MTEYYEENQPTSYSETMKVLSEFSEDVQTAFDHYSYGNLFMSCKNNDLVLFSLEDSVIEKIVLENAVFDFKLSGSYDGINKAICLDCYSMTKEDNIYVLTLQDPDEKEFIIRFTSAHTETSVIREEIFINHINNNPWSALSNCALQIAFRDASLKNEKETALTPLLSFVAFLFLSPYVFMFADGKTEPIIDGAQMFFEICEKLEFCELLKYKDKFIKYIKKGQNKQAKMFVTNFNTKLRSVKYKPIYDKIKLFITESQQSYPSLSELFTDKDAHSAAITARMRYYGYKGEYPEFYKDGRLEKTKFVNSNMQTYIITAKTPIRSFIRFYEAAISVVDEKPSPCFYILAATHAKRKKEEFAADASTCLFYDNGHLYSDCISYIDDENNADIEALIDMAIKKAEIQKITKEEKNLVFSNSKIPSIVFLFILFFGGLFFGFLFTLFMMLFCYLIEGFDPSVFTQISWIKFGIASGGAFGCLTSLVMFIVSKLSSN